MSLKGHFPPRFLPTLTEVVAPQELASPVLLASLPDTSESAAPTPATALSADALSADALVERVMQGLTPLLQARLRAVTEAWLHEQLRTLEPALSLAVTQAVHEDVSRAVAHELQALQAARRPD